MIIHLHAQYRKAYHQWIQHNPKHSETVRNRIQLFLDNPHHPLLCIHQLKGAKRNLWSFSVTGDIRIIFEQKDDNTIIFHDIGTHNQVY